MTLFRNLLLGIVVLGGILGGSCLQAMEQRRPTLLDNYPKSGLSYSHPEVMKPTDRGQGGKDPDVYSNGTRVYIWRAGATRVPMRFEDKNGQEYHIFDREKGIVYLSNGENKELFFLNSAGDFLPCTEEGELLSEPADSLEEEGPKKPKQQNFGDIFGRPSVLNRYIPSANEDPCCREMDEDLTETERTPVHKYGSYKLYYGSDGPYSIEGPNKEMYHVLKKAEADSYFSNYVPIVQKKGTKSFFFVDENFNLLPCTEEGELLSEEDHKGSKEPAKGEGWKSLGAGIGGGTFAAGIIHWLFSKKLYQLGQWAEKKIWEDPETSQERPQKTFKGLQDNLFSEILVGSEERTENEKIRAAPQKKEGFFKKVLSGGVRHGFWVTADGLSFLGGFYFGHWAWMRWASLRDE